MSQPLEIVNLRLSMTTLLTSTDILLSLMQEDENFKDSPPVVLMKKVRSLLSEVIEELKKDNIDEPKINILLNKIKSSILFKQAGMN